MPPPSTTPHPHLVKNEYYGNRSNIFILIKVKSISTNNLMKIVYQQTVWMYKTIKLGITNKFTDFAQLRGSGSLGTNCSGF